MRDSIAPKSVKKFKENYRRDDSKYFKNQFWPRTGTTSSSRARPHRSHNNRRPGRRSRTRGAGRIPAQERRAHGKVADMAVNIFPGVLERPDNKTGNRSLARRNKIGRRVIGQGLGEDFRVPRVGKRLPLYRNNSRNVSR